MSSSGYVNDFWIDQYANRVWTETFWTVAFAFVTLIPIVFWVFNPAWYFLLMAAFEYLCFLGHLKFAFDAQLALKNEMERRQ